MSAALSVSLAKRLPGFDLDVGWTVDRGFTVIFGYSGAGKSLTLAMITGTLRPDSGFVRLGGETLVDTRSGEWVPPQRRHFGFVSQDAALFPHMTVRRNIEYGLKGVPRPERGKRTDELLERLGILHLAEKRPRQLSGGERQRAALARALAPRPRALLLDEPLSALDLPVRVETRALLREVQRSLDIPVVMVTHDLIEAAELADTLVVYSGDGAVQVGRPGELIQDPGSPRIRRLLRAIELPEGIVSSRGWPRESARLTGEHA